MDLTSRGQLFPTLRSIRLLLTRITSARCSALQATHTFSADTSFIVAPTQNEDVPFTNNNPDLQSMPVSFSGFGHEMGMVRKFDRVLDMAETGVLSR